MRVQGTSSVQMSRVDLWKALTDPDTLSKALSAKVEPDRDGEDRWRVVIRPSLGSIGPAQLDATFELVDKEPQERLRIRMHAFGSENVIDVDGEARLSDADGRSTDVHWEGDVRLGGVIGSLGQRSAQDVLQTQVDRVLRSLGETPG